MENRTELPWWERPVRMMRLDYGPDLQRMRHEDLAELAHRKKHEWHINCEWVIGTPGIAPGLGYLVTFHSKHFPHYAALEGWDLIRNYLPHAKREGLHVLAYLNMHWYAYEFAAEHPGWEQLLADGRPYGRVHPLYGSGTTFCVNSGWRDWATLLVTEVARTGVDGVFLDGPVIYPGCCYCPACRKQFQAEYGEEPPPAEDWSSPLWKNFIEFREKSMASFLAAARAALKAVNPDGVIFLNAGSWHSGSWRVARNIEKVGAHQEFNGAEMFFHPGPNAAAPIPWAITAKHLVAAGKPAVVFSHHTLGAWHYIGLPPLEAKMAAAETVACGANPWIAVFDYALDHDREAVVAPINEFFGFLEKKEPYYTATESAAEVAVLYSRQSATFYISALDDIYEDRGSGREQHLIADTGTGQRIVDWRRRKQISDSLYGNEFAGWCLALSRQHIAYDVILDSHLTSGGLGKYKVVVLPNAACLSEEQVEALRRYVREGGNLVATFETARYLAQGEPRREGALDDVLGVGKLVGAFPPVAAEEYVEVTADTATSGGAAGSAGQPFRQGQLLPRPVYSLRVEAIAGRNTPIHYLTPTGRVYTAIGQVSEFAAALHGEEGTAGATSGDPAGSRGRVVYLPHALGDSYYRYRLQEHEEWLAYTVRWANNGAFAVSTTAPPTVQVEVRRQAERLLIHLVNHTGDTQRPYHFLYPVSDILVTVAGPPARKAYMLKSEAEVAAKASTHGTQYALPPLEHYDVLVLEE